MPNSIFNINKKSYVFHSRLSLQECIDSYFKYIQGEFEIIIVPSKVKGNAENIEEKIWLRHPEPPTLSGLAWYLGFAGLEEFEKYELNGKYSTRLKRARLRIVAEYEKKLHSTNATGAVFALKNMGWNDRPNAVPVMAGIIKIELVKSEIEPAASESGVTL